MIQCRILGKVGHPYRKQGVGQLPGPQNGEIYVGGGRSNGGHHHDSVIKYDTFSDSWINVGALPEIKYGADATVLKRIHICYLW